MKVVPTPTVGIDADLAAVLADDGEHGGEAEAGAVLLGGEERVEDLVEVLGLDAAGRCRCTSNCT